MGCACSKSRTSSFSEELDEAPIPVPPSWLHHADSAGQDLEFDQRMQEQQRHWEQVAMFSNLESLLAQLREPADGGLAPVKLLKSEWIMQRATAARSSGAEARKNLALPRRQDLDTDAFYTVEELTALDDDGDLCLISISYCWETAEHPDPCCTTLLNIAAAIKRAQKSHVKRVDGAEYWKLPPRAAIFLDWCSLCQKDEHGQRTPPEQRAFGEALSNMQLWYAHTSACRLASALQLSSSPEPSPGPPRARPCPGPCAGMHTTRAHE